MSGRLESRDAQESRPKCSRVAVVRRRCALRRTSFLAPPPSPPAFRRLARHVWRSSMRLLIFPRRAVPSSGAMAIPVTSMPTSSPCRREPDSDALALFLVEHATFFIPRRDGVAPASPADARAARRCVERLGRERFGAPTHHRLRAILTSAIFAHPAVLRHYAGAARRRSRSSRLICSTRASAGIPRASR